MQVAAPKPQTKAEAGGRAYSVHIKLESDLKISFSITNTKMFISSKSAQKNMEGVLFLSADWIKIKRKYEKLQLLTFLDALLHVD